VGPFPGKEHLHSPSRGGGLRDSCSWVVHRAEEVCLALFNRRLRAPVFDGKKKFMSRKLFAVLLPQDYPLEFKFSGRITDPDRRKLFKLPAKRCRFNLHGLIIDMIKLIYKK
jgi:hypothetical protein